MSFAPKSFTLKSCGSDIALLTQYDDNFQSLFTQKMQQLNKTAGSACQSQCGENLNVTSDLQACGQCLQGTSTPIVAKSTLVGCSTCYDFIAPLAYHLTGPANVSLPTADQITTFLNYTATQKQPILDQWNKVDDVVRLQVWEKVCGQDTFSYETSVTPIFSLSPAIPITPISSLSPAIPITPVIPLGPSSSSSASKSSGGLSGGAVAGIVIAVLFVIALSGWMLWRKRRTSHAMHPDEYGDDSGMSPEEIMAWAQGMHKAYDTGFPHMQGDSDGVT